MYVDCKKEDKTIYVEPLATANIDERIINFYPDRYEFDKSPAIIAIEKDTNSLWSIITVNLSDYCMNPKRGWIYLNHDLMPYLDDIVKTIGTGKTLPIKYGFANSITLELKPEIFDRLIKWWPEDN